MGLPQRSLTRKDPIAYAYNDGALTELDVEEPIANVADSIGLMRGQGGTTRLAQEDKNVVTAMYAMATFMVVCFQALLYIQPPTDSSVAPAFIFSLGGAIPGGMCWTMQCFMACMSYLLCDEPFKLSRVLCLALFCFALQWPIAPIVSF